MVLTARTLETSFGELIRNAVIGHALQEKTVDEFHGFCLLRVNGKLPVWSFVVTEEPLVGDGDLAVSESLSLAPGDVLRNGSGLLLSQGTHDRDEEFSLGIEGPDVFFLEKALSAVLLELPDGGQRVDRVPGKPGHALRDYKIDFTSQRIGNHAFEAFTVFGAGACDAFIRVDLDEFPVVTSLDEFRVVVDLRLVAGELFVVVCRDCILSIANP